MIGAIAPTTHIECRLCGGAASFVFTQMVVGKYQVSFFACQHCESLQSENPYWLAEAYSDKVLPIDPGLTHAIMYLFRCRTTLDYGGGAGLLTRLLRDIGRDAYWYDGYTPPSYATGFGGSPQSYHDLVTAFEVVEHFPNPNSDLNALFGAQPSAVLIMTYLYRGQDKDWWYIAPEEGQHIFFYSPKAIAIIAARFDYRPLICNGFILFSRAAPTFWQKLILQKFLTPRTLSWLRLIVLARRTDAPQRDSALLEARVRQNQRSVSG
jgi:hypothetical protein